MKLSWICTKWKFKFLQKLHTEVWSIMTYWTLTVHLLLWLHITWQGNICIFKHLIIIYNVSRCFKGRIVRLNQTYSRLRALLVHSGPSWHFPVDRLQQGCCEGRLSHTLMDENTRKIQFKIKVLEYVFLLRWLDQYFF